MKQQSIQQVDTILAHAADIFRHSPEELIGHSRRQSIVAARQAAMWVIRRRYPSFSLESIGAAIGGRHYSTVRHALAAVEARARQDNAYRDQLQRLLAQVTPPVSPPEAPARPLPRSAAWWSKTVYQQPQKDYL